MRKRVMMRQIGYMALALAVVGAMATRAQADVIFLQSGGDAPIGGGDAAEIAFVEGIVGQDNLTLLLKTEPDGSGGGITADATGTSADVSWAGLSQSLDFILVVDGTAGTVGNPCTDTTEGTTGGSCYSLYGVSDDQKFDSNGVQNVVLPSDSGGISHIVFLSGGGTSVPEPTTLVLLGAGLVGTALYRRKAR
jgi:hypothetical protein